MQQELRQLVLLVLHLQQLLVRRLVLLMRQVLSQQLVLLLLQKLALQFLQQLASLLQVVLPLQRPLVMLLLH